MWRKVQSRFKNAKIPKRNGTRIEQQPTMKFGLSSGRTTRPTIPKICLTLHPRLDLVNLVVRPPLLTKLILFSKSSLDKEQNMKKWAVVFSLNWVFHYIEVHKIESWVYLEFLIFNKIVSIVRTPLIKMCKNVWFTQILVLVLMTHASYFLYWILTVDT